MKNQLQLFNHDYLKSIKNDLFGQVELNFIPIKQEENSKLIHTYTKEQALDDGYLADVTEKSKEIGYKIPVTITKGVYDLVYNFSKELKNFQDPDGRLQDILFMSMLALKKELHQSKKEDKEPEYLIAFKVIMVKGFYKTNPIRLKKDTVKLWLIFTEHEGFTIMYPEEY